MIHYSPLPDFEGTSLLEALWRHKALVVAGALIVGAAGYAYENSRPEVFEASTRLLLADPREIGLFGELRAQSDPNRNVENQVALIESGVIAPRASELVDGRFDAAEVLDSTIVRGDDDADTIVITAQSRSAADAAEIANAVAEAYQDVVGGQVADTAQRAVDALEARNEALRAQMAAGDIDPELAATDPERVSAAEQLTENETRIAQIQVDAALYGSGVEYVAPAEEPGGPISPRPRRTAVIFAMLGAMMATAVAWWRTATGRRAESATDPAAILDAPLLGEIPEFSRAGVSGQRPMIDAPMSSAADAYQYVQSSLAFALSDFRGRSFLVTSGQPDDGKSVTTFNLAIAGARDGRRVIMIDADKRKHGLTKLCDLDVDELAAPIAVSGDSVARRLQLGRNLDVSIVEVGVHISDPASYFRTHQFRSTLEQLEQRCDTVFIDAPPLLAVSDTSAIAAHVDAIVLVIRQGTPLRVLTELRSRLDLIGTPIVGYVFNRSRGARTGGYYGAEPAPRAADEPPGIAKASK